MHGSRCPHTGPRESAEGKEGGDVINHGGVETYIYLYFFPKPSYQKSKESTRLPVPGGTHKPPRRKGMGEGTTEGKRYHAVEDGPADRGTDLLGFLLSQQWQVPAKGGWEDKAQKSSGIRDTRGL